jgi:hypothetical protein
LYAVRKTFEQAHGHPASFVLTSHRDCAAQILVDNIGIAAPTLAASFAVQSLSAICALSSARA